KIKELKYNVLDTSLSQSEGGSLEQRKHDIAGIKKSISQPGEHDLLFVAKQGEDVVGFLAIKKTPQGKKAAIRQLWTARPGETQRRVIGTLLGAAKQTLTASGYTKVDVERIRPSSGFRVVAAKPELGRVLRITDADTENKKSEHVDIPIDDEAEASGAVDMPKTESADNDEGPPADDAISLREAA
ncbi:MAG: hypothetical protein NUV59_04355, partial [Patescibacteria group bacterium]|nr:hypothetical protein [Patescibacteria group bacterium]